MSETDTVRRSARARKAIMHNGESSKNNHPPVQTGQTRKRSSDEAFDASDSAINDTAVEHRRSYAIAYKRETIIRTESLNDEQPPAAPQQARKARTSIKCETAADEELVVGRTKQKRTSKGKENDRSPRRLVVTAQMLRPPGERQPPILYEHVTKKRQANEPTLLAQMVSTFADRMLRARGKVPRLRLGEEEQRLKPYIDVPPDFYYDALERANSQRLFVLQRDRDVEQDCHTHQNDCPTENILLAGNSGNVYTITITHQPTCSCGDHVMRKRSCKHIIYVLHKVLKVTGHLQYQDAFLSSELHEIFHSAPPLPNDTIKEEPKDARRRPIEDDCPICCMAFNKEEAVVWCETSCGNNIHKQCFQKWASVRPGNITCPFCRAAWQDDKFKAQSTKLLDVTMPTHRNSNGYFNVGDQLGYL